MGKKIKILEEYSVRLIMQSGGKMGQGTKACQWYREAA